MILNNKLKNSLLIKKFQTGGKAGFDPYAGLYTTVKSESSSTNQVPQNIRNLREEEDKKANEIIRIKEAKEREARRIKEIEEKVRLRRENPDMMTGISESELKAAREFTDKIDNPTFTDRVAEVFKAPARYITNPIAALGDFDAAIHGSTKLPNTIEERKVDLARKHGSAYLTKDAMKKLDDKASGELDDILFNAGVELGTLGVFKGYKYLKNLNAMKKVVPKKLAAETAAHVGKEVVEGTASLIDNGGKTTFTSFADWKEKPSWARDFKASKNPIGYDKLPQYGDVKPKSSLDWGKWNKEIPGNKALMDEYGAIEAAAKKDGTWMKNADGTPFKGSNPTKEELAQHSVDMTPEEAIQAQFIQQRSKDFKKAFPKWEMAYHGTHQRDLVDVKNSLNRRQAFGEGLYTTKNKEEAAKRYAKTGKAEKSKVHTLAVNTENKTVFPNSRDEVQRDLRDWNKSDILSQEDALNKYKKYLGKDKLEDWEIREYLENIPVKENMPSKYKNLGEVIELQDKGWLLTKGKPKSLIGNRGTFNMSNPNIYKAIAAPVGFAGLVGSILNKKEL